MQRTKYMVWGGIWKKGRTELYISEDNIDSEEYQCILWDYLIDPCHEEYLEYMRLLQDNAPPHTSQSTRDFLDNFEVEVIEDYPPMSPDINAIERVWGWMENHINHKYVNNPEKYQQLIEEAWNEIAQTVIDSYISNVPNVLKQIKMKKGGNTSC
jgi:transposase